VCRANPQEPDVRGALLTRPAFGPRWMLESYNPAVTQCTEWMCSARFQLHVLELQAFNYVLEII
jgi:hypothetical protein